MADGSARTPNVNDLAVAQGLHPRLGRIVGLDDRARALVTFAGGQPSAASTLGPVTREELEQAAREQRVVVIAFLDGRADSPVLLSLYGPDEPAPEPEPEPELELEVDG